MEKHKKILLVKEYNKTVLSDIQEIAAPLKNYYNISLLTFRRLYPNGDIIHIANHKKWLEFSFSHSFWQSTSSLKRIKSIDTDNHPLVE